MPSQHQTRAERKSCFIVISAHISGASISSDAGERQTAASSCPCWLTKQEPRGQQTTTAHCPVQTNTPRHVSIPDATSPFHAHQPNLPSQYSSTALFHTCLPAPLFHSSPPFRMLPESDVPDASMGRCHCYSGRSSPESDDANCPHCPTPNRPSPSLPFPSSFFPTSDKDWKKLRRCIEASVKGFVIGAGLKGGLAAFSILARLRSRRCAGMVSNREAVVMAAKETLRYGLFLGTFAGTYVSVDEYVAAFGGDDRHDGKMEIPLSRVGCRAFAAFDWSKRAAYKLSRLHSHPCCCSGIKMWDKKQEIWTHLQTFDLVMSHGGKDVIILQVAKEIITSMPFTNLEGIEKYYKSQGMDLKLDQEMKIPCPICGKRRKWAKRGKSEKEEEMEGDNVNNKLFVFILLVSIG
ncbi:hypothetical protein ACLOJK_016260 [Asimina triloba]